MKRFLTIAALLSPLAASAQGTAIQKPGDFRMRNAINVEKSLGDKLSVHAEYQVRLEDMASCVESHRLTVGTDYEFNEWFDATLGYTFIGSFTADPHHRIFAEATGSYSLGNWKFSLREKLQFTHMTEALDRFEKPKNEVVLKSRFKVAYGGAGIVEPYAAVELRNTFNEVKYGDNGEFLGYGDVYVNRVRYIAGLELEMNDNNSIDLYLHLNDSREKSFEAGGNGRGDFTTIWEKKFYTTLGVAYKYSF